MVGSWDPPPLRKIPYTPGTVHMNHYSIPQLSLEYVEHGWLACRNVTNGGILDVLARCTKLDHLDLTGYEAFFLSLSFSLYA